MKSGCIHSELWHVGIEIETSIKSGVSSVGKGKKVLRCWMPGVSGTNSGTEIDWGGKRSYLSFEKRGKVPPPNITLSKIETQLVGLCFLVYNYNFRLKNKFYKSSATD